MAQFYQRFLDELFRRDANEASTYTVTMHTDTRVDDLYSSESLDQQGRRIAQLSAEIEALRSRVQRLEENTPRKRRGW